MNPVVRRIEITNVLDQLQASDADEQPSWKDLLVQEGPLHDKMKTFLAQPDEEIADQVAQNLEKVDMGYQSIDVCTRVYTFKQKDLDQPRNAVEIRLERLAKAKIKEVFSAIAAGLGFNRSSKELYQHELVHKKLENGIVQALCSNESEESLVDETNRKELQIAAKQCRKLTLRISKDVEFVSFEVGRSAPGNALVVTEMVVSGIKTALAVLTLLAMARR